MRLDSEACDTYSTVHLSDSEIQFVRVLVHVHRTFFPRRKCARFSLVLVDSHLHRRGLRRPLILCLLHSPLPATRPLCDCFRFTQLSHHIRSPHFRPIIARCGHLIVSLTTYLFVSYRIQSNRYISIALFFSFSVNCPASAALLCLLVHNSIPVFHAPPIPLSSPYLVSDSE